MEHRLFSRRRNTTFSAIDRRGDTAEVDLAAVDVGAKLPSWAAALRDVQTRDDLESRHHGQVERAGTSSRIEQETVDAVAHGASGPSYAST